jgi:hypothetical protein
MLRGVTFSLLSSVILVILSVIYFTISLWVIKLGAMLAGYSVEGSYAVLTAGIITAATIIGSAIK